MWCRPDTESKLNVETSRTQVLMKKKATSKTQNLYILLAFSLITISFCIAVSIYCYLVKYWAEQLLPFHYINDESHEVL